MFGKLNEYVILTFFVRMNFCQTALKIRPKNPSGTDKQTYCIVSYCIVPYCIEFYCIVLYCIVLYCIALHCIVVYCIVLYCNNKVGMLFTSLKPR